jgi:pyruvate,orthophosphate dikinase
MSADRWVLPFAEGSGELRGLLGGKGANIAEMMRVLGPERVPGGFTITTEACVAYMAGGRALPDGLRDEVAGALAGLEAESGKRLGDREDPLLVSVRSGARVSMPGMLDTVLNLGLNDESVEGLAARTANERFAWDSYRRFVQMYGTVVVGIDGARFQDVIAEAKRQRGVLVDVELDVAALREITNDFKAMFAFPVDPREQLERAICAVFDSWMGERAVHYRAISHIPDDWGTAVNVQQMVFGNKGSTSGSGVAFSRDELTGEPSPSGDFMVDAQGEDVVSGTRNTLDLSEMAVRLPVAYGELVEILRKLERHFGDMQDTEFTVEEGRLYMLQTRRAMRPAQAAVRFAVDAVNEGLLTRRQAMLTIDTRSLETLLHPTFDPSAHYSVLARGVGASPGAARGSIVFTATAAIAGAKAGVDVILVRPFTEAADVAGFHAARGILTAEGGKASHAALIARGLGRPAVTGASELQIDLAQAQVRVNGIALGEGDVITINGSSGEITTDDVVLVAPKVSAHFETVLEWADQLSTLGVRANADTPGDAQRALELGAQGIGLCRTEHMFLGERQPLMANVILADTDAARAAAIAALAPLQERDFEEILATMTGKPVTVRLLDPPFHEFLVRPDQLPAGSPERARIEALQESNPMLGTRGVRLGVLMPELYEMQVRALFRAAARVAGSVVEIMVPLVAYVEELTLIRKLIDRIAVEEEFDEYTVGTMIELPRACLQAGAIASHADFFSFGTNDLTQTGIGMSRDDIEGRLLPRYIEAKIIDRSPFETIDAPGIGELLRIGATRGRRTKPGLKLGVCGEHGGDPDSIEFFHNAKLDYVSCSPYRVPVARIAAAQATIRAATDPGPFTVESDRALSDTFADPGPFTVARDRALGDAFADNDRRDWAGYAHRPDAL